jgi:hypothetical protein
VLCCPAVVICCHSARRRWSQAAQLIKLRCCLFTMYCGVFTGGVCCQERVGRLHPRLHALLSLAVSAIVRVRSILSVAYVIQLRCCACSKIPTAPPADPLGRNLSKHRALSYACNRYLPWCGSTWHSPYLTNQAVRHLIGAFCCIVCDICVSCTPFFAVCRPIPTAPRADPLGRNLSKDKSPQELPPGMVLEDSGGQGARSSLVR